MKVNPLVSFVVPVFNVDKYLDECIESILNQDFEDYELILVNDGSTDRSGNICNKWRDRDGRITVIHKTNGGLSDARNVGMDIACGKYICFVDSDDMIDKNYLSALISTAEKFYADVVCCQAAASISSFAWNKNDSREISGVEACREYLLANCGVSPYAWAKLYRADLLRGFRFPKGKIHEDHYFTPRVLFKASKVVVLNSGLYFYRIVDTGIMHKKYSVNRFDIIDIMTENIKYFSDLGAPEYIINGFKMRRAIQHYLCIANAKKYGVSIPKEHRISEIRAFLIMHSLCKDDNYVCYYVSTVHPMFAKYLSYVMKFCKLLTRRGNKKAEL